MSKKKHSKTNLHSGPNMTPMVDIVMCILIFFMLGSTFTVPELYLTSKMPALDKGGLSQVKGDEKLPPVNDFIEIKRIGNQIVVTAFGKQYNVEAYDLDAPDKDSHDKSVEKEADKLKFDLADQLSRDLPEKQKALSQDVQIIIAPEPSVSYQAVLTVYDQVINARFAHVAFAPIKN